MKSVTEDRRDKRNIFIPVVSNLACPNFTHLSIQTVFLGGFTKVRKGTLVSSCLSAPVSMEKHGSHRTDLYELRGYNRASMISITLLSQLEERSGSENAGNFLTSCRTS